jgi:hypothetical protein
MLISPRTTFVGGNNPFTGLGARPVPTLELDPPAMQKPAKPARKNAKRLKDEDYSTPYQPPMEPPKVASDTPKVASAAAKVASPQRQFDSAAFVICDDPLPASRIIGPGKYDALFQQLGRGQAIKCPPDAVASTQHALRKWVKEQRVTGVLIKTCKDYGDGFGRVWLLAEPGQS